MRAPALASAVLALQGVIAAGQTAPVTALRFDWPRDLTATVDVERTRERDAGTTTSTTARASYRLSVAPHAEGLLVRYDNFTLPPGTGGDPASAAAALSALLPSLVVSADGAFRRAENLGPLKAAIAALMAPLARKDNVPPGLNALVAQLSSDEVLNNLAGSEWQALVAMWRDFPLTTGTVEREADEPSPILPDLRIPMRVSGRMIERTTCMRGGVSHECGVFEIQSTVNQAAMEPIMKRLMAGVAGVESVKYERLEVLTTARVRLEIRTMVPHELATVRTVQMTAVLPAEGRRSATQVDRRMTRFTY